MKINLLMWILFIPIISSCAKDMNNQDYQKIQLEEMSARMNELSGEYSGKLFSSLDKSTLGNMKLSLSTHTDVQTSSSDVISRQVLNLMGSISIVGIVNTEFEFTEGYFREDTKEIQLSFKAANTIQASPALILFKAKMINGALVGAMFTQGQEKYGLQFSLVRNKQFDAVSSLEIKGIRFNQINRSQLTYFGNLEVSNENLKIMMNFNHLDLGPLESLYKVISPRRVTELSMKIDNFSIHFKQVLIDDQRGTLVASNALSESGKELKATLSCQYFLAQGKDTYECLLVNKSKVFNLLLVSI